MKQLLAVQINGQCQLHCPHCYIDMKEWPKTLMQDSVIDSLPIENYNQVAIVATEPFFNRDSLRATVRLGERSRGAGKQFSVISNALGLAWALDTEPALAELLSWIDISMDVAGAEYASYRGGSWKKFLRGVQSAHKSGIEVTILNTVSQCSLPYFEEMIRTSEALSSEFFTVSPMITADSRQTDYRTSALDSVRSFLDLSASSRAFQKSTKVKLEIGLTICEQSREDIEELAHYSVILGIEKKVLFLNKNPDELIDRATIGGELILPSQTLLKSVQK